MGYFDWLRRMITKSANSEVKLRAAKSKLEVALACYDLESAMQALDEIISIDPEEKLAYLNRGHIFAEMEEQTRAITDYTKAIEIDPTCVEAYSGRGQVYSNLKQYREAVDDFSKAITIAPDYQSAYRRRGDSYFKLGLLEKTFDDYKMALELNPNDGLVYYSRATAHYSADQFQCAVDDYTSAIALNLGSELTKSCYSRRAKVYNKMGKPDLAKQDWKSENEVPEASTRHLPSELSSERASTKQVLSMINRRKCNFNEARTIDHTFSTQISNTETLIAALQRVGLILNSKKSTSEDLPEGETLVSLQFYEQAKLNDMPRRTQQLVRVAFEHDATYDGWGTMVD